MELLNILITGANGFIGRNLTKVLNEHHHLNVVGLSRQMKDGYIQSPNLTQRADWGECLQSVDVVIHLAGLAHVTAQATKSLERFRSVNTEGTLNFANQCVKAGVRRFISLSSIGVNGVESSVPFKFDDDVNPTEPYAISKYESEISLKDLAIKTKMEVVIIRPPLVYGHDAPGNFGKLLNLVAKNIPLPLGAIHNKRSLVGVDNLADLILTCIDHPRAANQTFLVSDDYDVSTSQLLKRMVVESGHKSRLLPIPVSLLESIASVFGKKTIINRICHDLQVDISHTKSLLSWKPPVSFDEGIRRCFKG